MNHLREFWNFFILPESNWGSMVMVFLKGATSIKADSSPITFFSTFFSSDSVYNSKLAINKDSLEKNSEFSDLKKIWSIVQVSFSTKTQVLSEISYFPFSSHFRSERNIFLTTRVGNRNFLRSPTLIRIGISI